MGSEEKPLPVTVADQIKDIVDGSLNEINDLTFGEILFGVRNGKIYRILISNSILIKGDKTNESK